MSADAVNAAATAATKAHRDAAGLHPGRPRLPARIRHMGRTADAPAPFPCQMLCLKCGFLVDPPATGGYRTDATPSFPHKCPACKARMWVDLQRAEALEMLEHDDQLHAETRDSAFVRWGSWAATTLSILSVGGGIALGGMYVLYRFARDGFLVPAILTLLVIGMTLTVVGSKMRGMLRLPLARPRPSRWRLPLPMKRVPKLPAAPAVEPSGNLLTAPLSGRPCIAYEVGIREDQDHGEPDGSWLLLDQRVADLRADATELSGNAITLDVASRRQFAPQKDDGEPTARYLRERGFTGHESVFLYETIVGPDEAVSLKTRRDGVVLSPG